jgi:hypothetical protein
MEGACQDQFASGGQVHQVTNTHIERAHVGSGAKHRAEAVPVMVKGDPGTALETGFRMGAYETAFGTADRGKIQENSQMTRNAEASWMRHALSIAEQDIRLPLEFAEGGKEGGSLAKREETRDIREEQPALGDLLFDECVGMEIPEDHSGDAVFAIR